MQFRGVALDDVAQKALAAMKAVDDFLRLVFGAKDENGCKKALWDKTEASTAVELLTTYMEGPPAWSLQTWPYTVPFFSPQM